MGAGMIIAIVIFIALIGGGIFAYMKKLFWFQKSGGRKYTEIRIPNTKSKSNGKCADGGTGVKTTTSKKSSSDCAAACDAVPTTCAGYDWDGTNCLLLPSKPTSVTAYAKGESCYAAP